jgi:general secretion pathway protein E
VRLGEILLKRGKITAAQLESALQRQRETTPHRRLGEWLMADGLISEADLVEALGEQFGLPVRVTFPEELLDPGLVGELPVDWARGHRVLPVRGEAGSVAMLTADPTRLSVQEDLALLLGRDVTPILAPSSVIREAIERCYVGQEKSTADLIQSLPGADADLPYTTTAEDLLRKSDQAPVTQLVNLMLLNAVKAGASDVHVEPFETSLQVRYRIDGLLYEQPPPPKHLEAALASRLKVMARLDIAEKRLPQDGMARVRVGDQEIDIRVSTIPVAEGERLVLRLLNRHSALLPLDRLGMPPDVLAGFRGLLKSAQGVILITGPTGSGKTTTLYAALNELDTRRLNILTIEDPIEYQLPRIGQIQVKPKIGLTFAQGLRHILRQDPDVILVGETRDLETAEIMVRASLTGHLVFSTLHTNDAASAVVRLVDMGVEPYLMASSLKACMAQRLIRTLCPRCKRPAALSAEEAEGLGAYAERVDARSLCQAVGCDACLGGYKGRTGIYELLVVSEDVQAAIRAGADDQDLRREGVRQRMRPLMDDGVAKINAGVTSAQEVLRCLGPASAAVPRAP